MSRHRLYRSAGLLSVIGFGGVNTSVAATELIVGTVQSDSDTKIPFVLSGEDLEDVVGGDIQLGDRVFRINKTSMRSLVGASRLEVSDNGAKFEYGEFITFSSSYSEQTAVGKPWAAAQTYIACDQAYNSFIALYRVFSESTVTKLGAVPYPLLTEDVANSDESTVYCFNSRKAENPPLDSVVEPENSKD